MFTGIVDHCGVLTRVENKSLGLQLEVTTQFEDLTEGESISVDGICLTAVSPKDGKFLCDLSIETLDKTIAQTYKVGQRVNLERALRLQDRLGGYLLTGHIEQTATVARRQDLGDCVDFLFRGIYPHFMRYLLPKGNICVQGVSLTVNSLDEGPEGAFHCLIIPHTLARTNLRDLKEGSQVNIEFDWITKVLTHQAERFAFSLKVSE